MPRAKRDRSGQSTMYRRPMCLTHEEMAVIDDLRWNGGFDTEVATIRYLVERGLSILEAVQTATVYEASLIKPDRVA